MNDWVIIAVIYLSLFISSPFIAVLHELGHALAYLVLTKPEKIDIYIGSYTRPKKRVRFNVGKINFFIKRSFPFVKGVGLCISSKPEANYINKIIILLAGPFFSFIAAGIISVIVFNGNAHILIQIACYIFLGLSVLSLISNLVPGEIGGNSNKLDNDGKQLLFVIKAKDKYADYIEVSKYMADKDFESAIAKLKNLLESLGNDQNILRWIISAGIHAKQYETALYYLKVLENNFELSVDDLFNKGCVQSFTNKHDEAIDTYSRVLKKNRNHLLALNNIGYELVEKGAHLVALRALEKAIKLKPDFNHAYSILGYSKILQGDLEEGKALIDKSIALNTNEAYAYKA